MSNICVLHILKTLVHLKLIVPLYLQYFFFFLTSGLCQKKIFGCDPLPYFLFYFFKSLWSFKYVSASSEYSYPHILDLDTQILKFNLCDFSITEVSFIFYSYKHFDIIITCWCCTKKSLLYLREMISHRLARVFLV